jgi:hypothetical protein
MKLGAPTLRAMAAGQTLSGGDLTIKP